MNRISLKDMLEINTPVSATKKLVNIRGCNGACKSTVPLMMKETDPDSFEITWYQDNKERILATVFPKYNFLAMGKYTTACGGMDSMKDTASIKLALKLLWNLDYNILMEGILASTVRQTYIDLFTDMNKQDLQRDIIVYNIVPPLDVCLKRIQQRNGGKPIKEELVESKYNTVEKNVKYFADAGFLSLRVSNENIDKDQTLTWFFDNIESSINNLMANKQNTHTDKPTTNEQNTYADVYIEPSCNLQQYDWYEDYKAPNSDLKMRKEYFDRYWNFIAERMNIYYKRVVLGEPSPWTDDEILKKFRFTNVIRDLDKLSIYERRYILNKIDEPVNDLELRKMSVLLNIMIFRLWVKIDTYEVHGFIDLSDANWKSKWETAKVKLLKRREDGIANFTNAYWVNNLISINPSIKSLKNKTMNACCVIESWIDNIQSIYQNAILNAKNMKEQMEYFQTLRCVGVFSAYEFACSITEITRYCKNHLVSWTQDSATSVGPGAERGIDWIFKDKGGMSNYQCVLYLRSIWKHELQRLGTYDRFVKQLPKELDGDIDLRVIEHCLCETQKYNKALTQTGRPREVFTPRTKDLSLLRESEE